jgi:predicted transcriptional regulator
MSKKLTYKEEEIMQILWQLEKAFVNDILEKMDDPKPPYNTVSSTIRKLEADGLIGYEAFGKTHRYFPILTKEAYRKTAFGSFMEHYFSGSPEEVLSFFVKEEKVNPDELNELLKKLKNKL